MKQGIHPSYGPTNYICACGNTFTIDSTSQRDTNIDICPKCHPMYTGKVKLLDSAGQIEKFLKKYKKTS